MTEAEIRYWLDHLDFLSVDQLYSLIDAIEANSNLIVVKAANLALRVKRHLHSRGLSGARVTGEPQSAAQPHWRPLPTRTTPAGEFQVHVAGRWRQRRAFTDECPNCLMSVAYYRDGGVVRGHCHTCGYQVIASIAWIRQQNPRRQGHGWERIKRLPRVREVHRVYG